MLRINGIRRLFFSALTAIVLTAAVAVAGNDDSYIQLTRISLLEGNVGYQRVPDEEWAAAGINMPLEPGDRIYTGRGGRAEIEFEEGSVLRLAENTDIEILTLDEDFVQIRMLLGIASITVEKGVLFEIATPAAAFSAEKNGIYRFEVTEDGRSEAIVRKGNLEADSNNFTREVKNGSLIRVHPDAAGPVVMTYNRRDAWDEWTDRRDADRRSLSASAARRYVPDNVYIGVTELDRHGRWVYVPNYGWGWVPYSVASGWSPYSVGRWVYRPRFGWTWVSYETWGWLPYHYGRWYRDTRFGWAWFPGEGFTFRFWSPGLVAFYRGPGWISWGPLGPGDYYDAAYYRYRGVYAPDLARVRVLVVRQPGNYINLNARGAFQTVNIDHFRGVNSGGQNANARRSDIAQPWRQGNLVRGGPDVSPARESFRPVTDRRAERPRAETNRPVVVRRTPSQASGNDGRFTQINNPRVSPARTNNAGRGNNDSSGSPAVRRSDENRPVSPGVTGGDSSGGRNRQAAPAQSGQSTPEAPAARQNRQSSSSRDSSGENRDLPAASKPAAPQENRPSAKPNAGGSSSSTRENGASDTGGNSSGGRNQQAAPASRSRSASEAPAGRQNNPGSSLRDSSTGQRQPRAGQSETRTTRPAQNGSSTASKPAGRR